MSLDPTRAAGGFLDIVMGAQTRGSGRAGMDGAARVEGAPEGPPTGLACPRCGSVLRDLHDDAGVHTLAPTQVIECRTCGFVGLRAR